MLFESHPDNVLLQLSLVQTCQHKLTVSRRALEMEMNTATPVRLHVTWDTNGREALREHVKLMDNGQDLQPLVKVP